MVDLNGDGDALDAGEVTTWAQGFGFLNGVTVDRQNAVYFHGLRYVQSRVPRRRRKQRRRCTGRGRSDAVQRRHCRPGERAGPPRRRAGDQLHARDRCTGSSTPTTTATHWTRERTLSTRPTRSLRRQGFCRPPTAIYFVGSLSGNAIFRVRDTNGDGDALDVAEVLVYADNVYGPINGSWGLAPRPAADFWQPTIPASASSRSATRTATETHWTSASRFCSPTA